jgi:hypothetical protein
MWGLYDNMWWWDHLTHTLSSALIGILAAMSLFMIDNNSDSIHLPIWAYPLFILIFSVFTGALWEMGEFVGDALFGTRMQYSLTDTLNDLYFNMLGGIVGSLLWNHLLINGSSGELQNVVSDDMIERLRDRLPHRP